MNKKTYVEQALHNNKGITRLLDCSIQNDNEEDRIMSNLIMSDDILSEDSKYFQIDTWWNNKMETLSRKKLQMIMVELKFVIVFQVIKNIFGFHYGM